MARTARDRIEGDPLSAAVYAALIEEVGKIGEYDVEEKLTSIHVVHGRAFLGVHPRKGALLVNIVLDHPLDPARLHRTSLSSALAPRDPPPLPRGTRRRTHRMDHQRLRSDRPTIV